MKSRSIMIPQRILPTLLIPDEVMTHEEKLLVVDVQNPKYITNIIPKAQRLNADIFLKDIPKTQPVLLACLCGQRSFAAAQQLIQLRYERVYVLKGGIIAWQKAGYMTQCVELYF